MLKLFFRTPCICNLTVHDLPFDEKLYIFLLFITIKFSGWPSIPILPDEVYISSADSDDWNGYFMGPGR